MTRTRSEDRDPSKVHADPETKKKKENKAEQPMAAVAEDVLDEEEMVARMLAVGEAQQQVRKYL